MHNILKSVLGLGALAAVHAVPVTFTDIVTPSSAVKLTDGGAVETYTYTHNIVDNGFVSATDHILSANIDISRRGDFYFNDSRLYVNADRTAPVAAVPEPGSMALMGLGMLGLGFAVRRNKKA